MRNPKGAYPVGQYRDAWSRSRRSARPKPQPKPKSESYAEFHTRLDSERAQLQIARIQRLRRLAKPNGWPIYLENLNQGTIQCGELRISGTVLQLIEMLTAGGSALSGDWGRRCSSPNSA